MNGTKNLRITFSGGGFRATFYGLGAFRRLVELGFDNRVSHINSVSGGSFLAAQIMCALCDGPFESVQDFDYRVTRFIVKLGQCNLRRKIMRKVMYPAFPRTRFSQLLPVFLDDIIYENRRLHDLPEKPELSIHATCLNTGKRFRFKQRDMGGNLLGVTRDIQDIKVSFAVACSAAFPMMFAPLKLSTKTRMFYQKWWESKPVLNTKSLPETLYIADGGVYDNLGSESLTKYMDPFIICDASSFLEQWSYQKKPNWLSLANRPLDVGLEQVVLLRRRLLYSEAQKKNGYQLLLRDPIHLFIEDPENYGKLNDDRYELPAYKAMPVEHQKLLARLRTDLDGFHDIEINSLIWSGAAKMDLVIKRYFQDLIPESMVSKVPPVPEFQEKYALEILKKGSKRRYLTGLHKNLQ